MSDDFSADLAAALANDKAAGYRSEFFQRIVLAWMDSNGTEWTHIKDVLRDRGVLQDYLVRIKVKAHELRGVVEIGGPPKGANTVLDAWPDAPVSRDCEPPADYGFEDPRAAVYRIETKTVDGQRVFRRVPVSYDPIVITRRMQQKDTGSIFLELSWRLEAGQKWHSHVFERDTVFSSKKIVDCSKYGAPIGSDNASEMVQYLRAYETENRRSIPIGYAQTSMGWLGDDDDLGHHGFLVGDRQIGGNGQVIEFMGEAAKEFKQAGTLEGWKTAIARFDRWPCIRIAVCACLAPPLVGIVGAPNTIVEFAGESSVGKSVSLRFGSTCWRSAASKLARWNATANGLEARVQVLNDLPLVVDDTADIPESKRRDLLGQAVYMLESGHTRTRSTKTLQQAPAKQWRTVVLSSGEYSMTDYIGTGGASARVLSFWGPPLGDASDETAALIHDTTRELSKHYGIAGPKFVEWLCKHRDQWDDFAAAYTGLVAQIRRSLDSRVAMRLAETIALLELTSRLAGEALGMNWGQRSLRADPYIQGAIAKAMEQALLSSNKAREAWEYAVSFAESRRSQWAVWGDTPSLKEEPNGGWLGWKRLGDPGEQRGIAFEDDDGADLLAWHPVHLKRVLQDGGFMPEVTLKAWREHGILLTNHGRLTSVAKCAGSDRSVRVLLMKASKTKWDE